MKGIKEVAKHDGMKLRSQLRLEEGYDECSDAICAHCNGPLPNDPWMQLLCPGLPSLWVAVCDQCSEKAQDTLPVELLLNAMKESL